VIGMIAAGKTTYCKEEIRKDPNKIMFPEPSFENPYLEKFYKNPKKWAYTMQKYLFEIRLDFYKQAVDLAEKEGKYCILDTSVQTDWTYAYLNYYYEGNICKSDFEEYEKNYKMITKMLRKPDKVTYLKCEAKVSKKRIYVRAKLNKQLDCENLIKLPYLENQKTCIELLLNLMNLETQSDCKCTPTIFVTKNWDDFGKLGFFRELISYFLKGLITIWNVGKCIF